MIPITNENLYSTALHYAVGIISTFPIYEDSEPDQILEDILQRAKDILLETRS